MKPHTHPIDPWDSDHTALVHVLWDARRDGLTIEDADRLASKIMQSRWMRAARQHAGEAVVKRLRDEGEREAFMDSTTYEEVAELVEDMIAPARKPGRDV